MTSDIQVSFPQELAFALKMQERELAREMLRLSIIKLYELGKISSGTAARILGLTRITFLELLSDYQVSIMGNPTLEELREDLTHA